MGDSNPVSANVKAFFSPVSRGSEPLLVCLKAFRTRYEVPSRKQWKTNVVLSGQECLRKGAGTEVDYGLAKGWQCCLKHSCRWLDTAWFPLCWKRRHAATCVHVCVKIQKKSKKNTLSPLTQEVNEKQAVVWVPEREAQLPIQSHC